jgi:hypothetical protein
MKTERAGARMNPPALDRAHRSALAAGISLRIAAPNVEPGPLANAMYLAASEADDLARRVVWFGGHARVLTRKPELSEPEPETQR